MAGYIASWDGRSLGLGKIEDGALTGLEVVEAADGIGSVETDVSGGIDCLLWPLELAFLGHFSLPLAHPRLLDAAILGQEMAEQTGEDATDWWLAWEAEHSDTGVDGLLAALPRRDKDALTADPKWDTCPFVGIDACSRLSALYAGDVKTCAVLDTDSEGWFVGVVCDGIWQGMRRLNHTDTRSLEDVAEDMCRTMASMGFDAASQPACGRLDEAMASHLLSRLTDWRGETLLKLPGRHEANIGAALLAQTRGPNFRRGEWTVARGWQRQLYPLRRAGILAVCLVALLLAGDAWSVMRLKHRVSALRDGIEAAFHRGLPAEKVMVDPLAQLRAAAGVRGSGIQAGVILNRLQALAEAKTAGADFRIVQLSYTGSDMVLQGETGSFKAVERVRDTLAAHAIGDVHIEDTVMEGKRVRFRIRWQ